ncbi:unnamed protein product [Larinioides sclopetarius]|uniref:Uncharacterized protein n=1 Tax=Larinioides sclopetarius TaxID=280406 RepID=A0AAV1ZB88_9ARAC
MYLGKTVISAVFTVPAYFNYCQRQATVDITKIASINVFRLTNKPTAAAISYGFGKKTDVDRNVLIFDLGGGTLDVSILTIAEGTFEVKATAGDTHLGGEDFDTRLADYFAKEFTQKHKNDLTKILNRSINEDETVAYDAPIQAAIANSDKSAEVQNFVLLDVMPLSVGIEAYDGLMKVLILKNSIIPATRLINLTTASDNQTSLLLNILKSERPLAKDNRLIGQWAVYGIPPAPRNIPLLNRSINEDETVAYDASIQAAIANGVKSAEVQNLVLLDVMPLFVGIEAYVGLMKAIIPKNTIIPVTRLINLTQLRLITRHLYY